MSREESVASVDSKRQQEVSLDKSMSEQAARKTILSGKENDYVDVNQSRSPGGKAVKKLRRSHQSRASIVKHVRGENAAGNLSMSKDLEAPDEESNFDFQGMYAAQIDSLPLEGLHASNSQPHTLREGATANRRLSEAGQLASNSIYPYGSHYGKGRKANINGYHTFKESQLNTRAADA